MKRHCAYLAILAALLFLTACGRQKTIDDQPTDPVPTAPAVQPADDLSSFRADMKPPVMAVADFGFPDLSEESDVMAYLLAEYSQWMEDHDFIGNISGDRIVRTCGYEDWGNLLCIVPRDPASTVTVNVMMYMDHEPYARETVAYHSESGEPILLLADISENSTVSVVVTDSEGRGVSWTPYWDNALPIPEDGYTGALVMDFTPNPEYSFTERRMDAGWYTPDPVSLDATVWESDEGYALEFYYDPGKMYDGSADIYSIQEDGSYEVIYYGNWVMNGTNLELNLSSVSDEADTIQDSFPMLMEPEYGTWIWVSEGAGGKRLPFHWAEEGGTELKKLGATAEGSAYDACAAEGWYKPELYQLMDTFWLSDCGYALELTDNYVPNDYEGNAALYDVGSIGEYTESYTGSWKYEYGYIHLSLVPLHGDGWLVDDTFPVLMDPSGEERLFIGRNENGTGLPHFPSDLQGDKLEQPKG